MAAVMPQNLPEPLEGGVENMQGGDRVLGRRSKTRRSQSFLGRSWGANASPMSGILKKGLENSETACEVAAWL